MNAEMDTEITMGASKLEAVVGRATTLEFEENTEINAGAYIAAVSGKVKAKTKEHTTELVYASWAPTIFPTTGRVSEAVFREHNESFEIEEEIEMPDFGAEMGRATMIDFE